MATSNCWVANILHNIYCVKQKIETYTGLEQLEGWVDNDRILILGELFKMSICGWLLWLTDLYLQAHTAGHAAEHQIDADV